MFKNDRYLRHSLIDWFEQDMVKSQHIAVIGAGAIGNELIKNLVLLGVGFIDIFDFDTIEIHNLTRSVLFREADIGKNKAACAMDRAKELDPNVKVRAFTKDFWDCISISSLSKYNCVICCVDNFESRIKLNKMCFLAGVDFINTAIDSRYVSVELFPFSSNQDVACYECSLPPSAYQEIARRYSCGWLKRISFVERVIPTTIVTSSIAGSIAASMSLRLNQDNNSTFSKRIFFDTRTNKSTVCEIIKNSECGGCAGFDKKPVIIRTQKYVDSILYRYLNDVDLDMTIQTSDQIITNYKCMNCNDETHSFKYIGKRASDFDDSIFTCEVCKQKGVRIEIRDQFTIRELISLFGGSTIPVKYINTVINNDFICFDLEEDVMNE